MHFHHVICRKNSFPVWLLFPCILSLVSTGCTMCPSPFDYSGTVPGSANQNDFRLRANGVLPIWMRPKPWPPVVSQEADESSSMASNLDNETQRTSRIVVASHEEEKNNHSKENSVLITKQTERTSTNDNQLIQQSDSNNTLETITKPTTNKGRESTEK
jgi:hypothetical protein